MILLPRKASGHATLKEGRRRRAQGWPCPVLNWTVFWEGGERENIGRSGWALLSCPSGAGGGSLLKQCGEEKLCTGPKCQLHLCTFKYSSHHMKKWKETSEIDMNSTFYLTQVNQVMITSTYNQHKIINELADRFWVFFFFFFFFTFLVAQMVMNLPAIQETLVWSQGQEDPLLKGMANHSSILGLPWWLRIRPQCRRPELNPWVGKICWRREWLPTLVSLPGEFHGQRSLIGYSPWDHKELDTTE